MADQEETPTVEIPVAPVTSESQETQQDDGRGEDPAPTGEEEQKMAEVHMNLFITLFIITQFWI